jgi:hypothetical protein
MLCSARCTPTSLVLFPFGHSRTLYIYNLNAIIVQPMPSHTNASFIVTFSKVFAIHRARDYQPALNVMDNKCSKAVEKHIQANKMDIQLIPPHNHHVNATECAIPMSKEYFVATLATVDMLCPLQLWDEFLPQVKLTLNLSHFYRHNPRILANQELTARSITTRCPLLLLGWKHWFTMILQQEPPGRRMQLTVSTLARPTTTTVVFISTSHRLGASTLWTRGYCLQPIAKSLLHPNTTKPYSLRLTSLNNLDIQSRLWPVPSSSISLQFTSSPQLCPASSISHHPFLHLQGWRLTHLQGRQLQHLRGWQQHQTLAQRCAQFVG